MLRKVMTIIFIILFSFSMLLSQEYDLETVIKLAKEKSREIELANAEVENASALKKEAFSNALPTFDLNVGYNRNFMESIFFFTVTDTTGAEQTSSFKTSFNNQYQFNAVLNQTIYSFGKVGSAITAAGYYEKFIENQYNTQEQAVVTNAKKAFYQALLAIKVWDVARASEASAKENYENIKLKYESGTESEFALLQSEVQWHNAVPRTIEAQKNYELSLNNLKRLTLIAQSEKITLKGNLESYPQLPEMYNLDQVLKIRPDYQALLWEKKLREKNVDIQFAEHLPSIDGSLTYAFQAASDDFKIENDNDNLILGISVSISIYSGGFTNAQVQKARIDVKRNQTQIDMLRDNIEIDLNNIYLLMQETYQQIQASQKSSDTAQRAYEIAESRVQNGLAIQVELKQSRTDLDQAQLTYYTAIYNYLNAYFDWENITGNISYK